MDVKFGASGIWPVSKSPFRVSKIYTKYMLYGETGRVQLTISIKTRMVLYWAKIMSPNRKKLNSIV